MDEVEPAERGEGAQGDLARVGDQADAVGGGDHRALDRDVGQCGIGQPRLDVDRRGGEEQGLREQAAEIVGGAVAAQRQRRRLEMARSEEHTSELQSLMRISYAVFCLKKKK